MAFGHNEEDEKKLKAKKAAGKRPTKKKTAAKKQTGKSQDAAESSAAGKAKSTTPLLPKAGRNGTPPGAKRERQRKSGGGCEGCSDGCTVEDPIEAAKRMMKGSVPAIVEALVKQAKQGSCPHAKTLLEMTGAKFMFDDGPESRDDGERWARLVLERMEQAEREKTDGSKA